MGISERLREERVRLGFKSQTAFAEMVGIHHKSQANYETGARSPDADYLSAIAAAGADILYILTGPRSGAAHTLSPRALAIADNYDHCPPAVQDALDAASLAWQKPPVKRGKAA